MSEIPSKPPNQAVERPALAFELGREFDNRTYTEQELLNNPLAPYIPRLAIDGYLTCLIIRTITFSEALIATLYFGGPGGDAGIVAFGVGGFAFFWVGL